MKDYLFTNNWFDSMARPVWEQLIPRIKPQKILEVGSYEGASTCYLIDMLSGQAGLEIHCIDTWEGSIEHKTDGIDMNSVEARFDHNIALALANDACGTTVVKHKEQSDTALCRLIGTGKKNHFDFVYIDGSHQAPDVLCDAVLGFRLLKAGGYMAFDDYLWSENLPGGKDPIRCPKPAIDAFTNLYCRKLNILQAPLYQIYIQKLAD